jgi:hypothetical protein
MKPHLPDADFCLSPATTGAAIAAATMIAARMPSTFLFKRSLLQRRPLFWRPDSSRWCLATFSQILIKFHAKNQHNKKGRSSGAPALTPVTCLTPHVEHTQCTRQVRRSVPSPCRLRNEGSGRCFNSTSQIVVLGADLGNPRISPDRYRQVTSSAVTCCRLSGHPFLRDRATRHACGRPRG